MKEVTDSKILEELNRKEVSDPGILAQLEDKTQGPGFLEKTISNIPGSAYEYGKGIVSAVTSPVQTGKALGKIAVGAGQLLIPGEQGEEQYAEALGEFFKERYGGLENIKKTISEDPVGFMGDLSTFLTGVGGVAGKIGPISKIGQTISKIGQVAEPVSMGMKGLSMPAKLIPKSTISKMYESAAKFSTTLKPKQRMKLVNTALEHEINISVRGMDKIEGLISDLNQQITNKIDTATQTGKTVPIKDLFKNFNALEDEARLSGRPMENLKTLKKIRDSIQDANAQINKQALTTKEAQVLKQKIYKDIESYYSSVRESPISIKAQKMIAKNAKEAIEDIIPEVKMLNQQEGVLIELRDALEKSTNRITNRDILGIGLPIKVAAGGIPGGVRGAVLGLTFGLIDTPTVKSKLSLVLNRLKQQGIKVRPTSTAIRLGLFQVGREKIESED